MKDKEQFLIELMDSKYIGDDGAIIGDMVVSSDGFFENTHFKREWMSPYQIGYKAMVVNISDAVAMNATAKYALVTISLPKDLDNSYIKEIVRGLSECAKEYGCEIVGGDTIGADAINISITIISYSQNPLTRKGVRDGDILAYTGTLGEALRDLNRLFKGQKIAKDSKFYKPILRYEFIKKAREYLIGGMDISDGLFCDTNKLLDLNSVGLSIIKEIDNSVGLSGEEYEMLIAFNQENLSIIETIANECGTTVTPFAKIDSSNSFRYPCKSHHF